MNRLQLTLALVFFPSLVAPAAAQPRPDDRPEPRPITALDIARLRLVQTAVISPDAAHIAYLLSVPRIPMKDKDGPAWSELHVVDAQGRSRPFVTGEVNVEDIAWAPDGRGISFISKRGRDKHSSIYLIPIDGGEARRVVAHDTDIASYSWRPDGNLIAFIATPEAPKARRDLKDKGFTAEIFEEENINAKVWLATPDKPDAKARALDLTGSASAVEWSPDGAHILVTLAPSPRIDDQYMNKSLNVFEANTSKLVARFETPGKLGRACWSPDGKHVAAISAADRNDPGEGRLVIGAAAGGKMTDVLPGLQGHVTSIAWQSADTVMFTADEGVSSIFGKVRADGSDRKDIVPSGRHVLAGLTLSRDGMSGAFVSGSATHPPEVFAMKHGDSEPHRLTTVNPWLSDIRLAKQEVITYKARDGLDLQGILIHPLDEKKGARYPLVLLVHGGPESHLNDAWVTRYAEPGQLLAARGFVVFYPNYRGSTGRGVEFSKLGQADEAGKEFDDLVDAADHLIATGLVDKNKVGLAGGSYGGFAAAWAATFYSDRYAAAVMFVGISDQISKVGTTDIPQEDFLVHKRKRPWDDWKWFLERSPIYHVQKSRTPLLILGGKDDPRVHPGQSMELYRYLKTLAQAPVRLVQYPGEGHGNRKAAARYDYTLRLVQWMEHYLKGPGGDPPPSRLAYDELKKSAASAPAAGDGD